MYLCAVSDESLAVPGDKVDKIWHCHLWMNADYNRLTKKLCGHIIRHEPHLDGDEHDPKSGQNLVDASFKHFGSFIFDPILIDHINGCSACDGNGCMNCHNGCKAS